jgi:hypothetical protein
MAMTIKSRIFALVLLVGLALTSAVSTLGAPGDAAPTLGAANAAAAAMPIVLAQYNPCPGGRCR